jgi:AcrR family transcriptional regulator
MARPARRQREIEHTRKDILHAAARAFSRLGTERATVRDIANEAGYTAASLYAYFRGKQQIIDALFASIVDEIREVFDTEPPAGLSFSQRLEFLFRCLAELSDRWGEARRLVFESNRCSEAARKRPGTMLREDAFIKRLTRWIEKNATSPEDLGGKDSEEVACMTAGLIRGAGLIAERDHFRTSARHRFDLALQICLHGIGGVVRARPTSKGGRDD